MRQVVIGLARQALASSMPMLVLRGGDERARAGGDIDILVPSSEAIRACQLIAAQAQQSGWYLAGFRNIGYVASITLLRPGINGCDDAIKLDLISGLEWYAMGKGAVTTKFFDLVKRHSNDQARVERLIAFATFFQKIMASGRLSPREWLRVRDGAHQDEAFSEVANIVGVPLHAGDVCENGIRKRRQWQLRAASAGVSGLWGYSLWFPRVAFAHLRFKIGIGSHAGHVIGLSGLDGSGKSTQMERLFAAYRQAGGVQPRLVHLLPGWIPLPHQLLRRKKTEQNYTKPYAEAAVKSKWNGLMRLTYYLLAFTVAKWWMRMSAMRGQVIVLDRSFADFSADLTRSRIPDFQLPRWLIRLCAPIGSLLYLDALPETVVRRKGELQLDKANVLRQRYLNVFRQINGEVIDAEGTPDMVFTKLLQQLDSFYGKRLSAQAASVCARAVRMEIR